NQPHSHPLPINPSSSNQPGFGNAWTRAMNTARGQNIMIRGMMEMAVRQARFEDRQDGLVQDHRPKKRARTQREEPLRAKRQISVVKAKK
ncbi:hypothetical protein AAF712_012481, partial [Marasmius tenuissimus]